ncbi:hypothetical protein [Psychroflexus sp. ALD_RP9]|uniref:hypothetical protein n=1 Tax=Psychroflexus sp. ALD_RP9 TaxID=2777186 RepID=UPI001A90BD96|nr:hypothetical protein [Psychroflexus sp. ALD_RP9]QSS97540.1 hypothetical protein IMZ30_02180 [Psychroflexus sp. ALD_RP9]
MKKVCSIIALSAMTLSLSSFNSSNTSMFRSETDCVQLAMDVHDSWTRQGFTDRYAAGKADEAYESCTSHAGQTGTEATLTEAR